MVRIMPVQPEAMNEDVDGSCEMRVSGLLAGSAEGEGPTRPA